MSACRSEPADDGPLRFRDMSGAEFFWTGTEVHLIAGVSPPLPECDEGQRASYKVLSSSRFFVVIGACNDGIGNIWWGRDRIVVCEHDDDCPQRETAAYECRAGFCQDVDASTELTYPDMFSLCFGHEPREAYPDGYPLSDESEIAMAIDDACAGALDPCEGPLPASCPDPN